MFVLIRGRYAHGKQLKIDEKIKIKQLYFLINWFELFEDIQKSI